MKVYMERQEASLYSLFFFFFFIFFYFLLDSQRYGQKSAAGCRLIFFSNFSNLPNVSILIFRKKVNIFQAAFKARFELKPFVMFQQNGIETLFYDRNSLITAMHPTPQKDQNWAY